MGIGVVDRKINPLVEQVARYKARIQRVVTREPVGSAGVHVAILAVEAVNRVHSRIGAFVKYAVTFLVVVLNRIQVNAARSRVLHGNQRIPQDLPLYREVPALVVCGGQVLLYVTQAGVIKPERPCPGKGSQVVGLERLYPGKHGVELRRRVLDHIEGYVAKVALVGNTVAAAQAGLAVAKHVPGEANPGTEVMVLGLPPPPPPPARPSPS